MNETNGGRETYMTTEEVAAYLKLANQTIRKYVLNKTIPYRKVKNSVRFRLSEIEKWIDSGGGDCSDFQVNDREGDLFAGVEGGEPEGTWVDGETGKLRNPERLRNDGHRHGH
jgi:excisionase family DNA binding protein